jgi:hypothetical protein
MNNELKGIFLGPSDSLVCQKTSDTDTCRLINFPYSYKIFQSQNIQCGVFAITCMCYQHVAVSVIYRSEGKCLSFHQQVHFFVRVALGRNRTLLNLTLTSKGKHSQIILGYSFRLGF